MKEKSREYTFEILNIFSQAFEDVVKNRKDLPEEVFTKYCHGLLVKIYTRRQDFNKRFLNGFKILIEQIEKSKT